MCDVDLDVLEAYFKERRIPTATGIRMVLAEYMKEKGGGEVGSMRPYFRAM
jgi:hypothetical protein